MAARGGAIMFLISNFTHSAVARGRQDANNIYHLLRGLVGGGLALPICLTGADGAGDPRSLQMDSPERGGTARAFENATADQ